MNYSPSDCFETFPFPESLGSLEVIGERYHEHRRQLMLDNNQGLTATYNRFHDQEDTDSGIQKLRELHVEMDEAVKLAYGWDDLKLDHDFHETKQGLRYTISEAARREVLDRLLALNHERHQVEVDLGLVDQKGKPTKTGKAWLASRTPGEITAITKDTVASTNKVESKGKLFADKEHRGMFKDE